MTDLPDHVRMHLEAIWQRMDEESQAARVALYKFNEEQNRVRQTYPSSSFNEMYQKYAVPYFVEAEAHLAVVDRLWVDIQAIQQFWWGQQEP
jgi:hypothetical protein